MKKTSCIVHCLLLIFCRCVVVSSIDNAEDKTCSISTLKEKEPLVSDILAYHDYQEDVESKPYSGGDDALGYVTPWNSAGYDYAVKYAHKFTLLSPVWYQIRTDAETSLPTLTGKHDVDQTWISKVRNRNPSLNIVPRFAFEMNSLSNTEAEAIIRLVLDEVLEKQYDGIVIEIPVIEPTIGFLSSLGSRLEVLRKKLVIVIGPSILLESRSGAVIFKQLLQLLPNIHRISLNMYDFPALDGRLSRPNAPIEWSQEVIKAFKRNRAEEVVSKVLLGIPFYGYKHTSSHEAGVPVVAHEYLDILRQYGTSGEDSNNNGALKWDDGAKEAYFESNDLPDSNSYVRVYFPTLRFISHRRDFAAESKMAGIAVWEIGQGLECFFNVL